MSELRKNNAAPKDRAVEDVSRSTPYAARATFTPARSAVRMTHWPPISPAIRPSSAIPPSDALSPSRARSRNCRVEIDTSLADTGDRSRTARSAPDLQLRRSSLPTPSRSRRKTSYSSLVHCSRPRASRPAAHSTTSIWPNFQDATRGNTADLSPVRGADSDRSRSPAQLTRRRIAARSRARLEQNPRVRHRSNRPYTITIPSRNMPME